MPAVSATLEFEAIATRRFSAISLIFERRRQAVFGEQVPDRTGAAVQTSCHADVRTSRIDNGGLGVGVSERQAASATSSA
jgi:hypothetical protein